jgi:hypothetical protein
MIRIGLERRLAIVATAALTLAIWVLPAGAASVIEARGFLATNGPGAGRMQSPATDLLCNMLYRNGTSSWIFEGTRYE